MRWSGIDRKYRIDQFKSRSYAKGRIGLPMLMLAGANAMPCCVGRWCCGCGCWPPFWRDVMRDEMRLGTGRAEPTSLQCQARRAGLLVDAMRCDSATATGGRASLVFARSGVAVSAAPLVCVLMIPWFWAKAQSGQRYYAEAEVSCPWLCVRQSGVPRSAEHHQPFRCLQLFACLSAIQASSALPLG
jgi:hypothetical protein